MKLIIQVDSKKQENDADVNVYYEIVHSFL